MPERYLFAVRESGLGYQLFLHPDGERPVHAMIRGEGTFDAITEAYVESLERHEMPAHEVVLANAVDAHQLAGPVAEAAGAWLEEMAFEVPERRTVSIEVTTDKAWPYALVDRDGRDL